MIFSFLSFLPAGASYAGENGRPVVSTGTVREARSPDRLAIGITDLGPQVRLYVTPAWAGEARFMMGSASSNAGSIQSMVFGLRAYRFFKEHRRCRLYAGLEGAYAQTSIHGSYEAAGGNGGNNSTITRASGFGDTTGYAAGAFAGVELRVFRRVAVDLDMGPYLISLKEKSTGYSGSTTDFVVNTALMFSLF